MHIRWEAVPRLPRQGWIPLLAVAVWAALVTVRVALGGQGTTCLFKNVVHVPCPTCGGTRAVLGLVEGDLLGAWLANPLLLTVLLLFCALLAIRGLRGRWPVLSLDRSLRPALWIAILGVFLANWAFLIATDR